MNKTQKLLNYLPSYWKKDDDSNNHNFLTSFDSEYQFLEEQIIELKKNIQLSTATGNQLNQIGMIFLLPRLDNETDTDYRARIKAFWPGFSGGGTKQSIRQTIHRMTTIPEDDIEITEFHSGTYVQPLKFIIKVTIPGLGVTASTVSAVLQNTKAAGVYLIANINPQTVDVYDYQAVDNETISDNIYFYTDFSEPETAVPK